MEKRSPSGEPIIERDTGFKRRLKRLLGIFVFRQSYLDLANVHIDAAERRARLVGEWQNYGVLMALIAGFAVQIYMDPPQTKVDGNATWMPTLFGIFIVVALASNFFGILLTLSFYRALNAIPDRKNKKFIRSLSFVLGIPTIFLMLGVISFCAAMVVAARLLYDDAIFIFICVLTGCICLVWLLIHLYTPLVLRALRSA
ncbi:uncharacterized protein ACA1_295950 [Acanthamoeba castellanii str. Neff]|uniref:Uncharacterized protein n=1 Tax=Acanthamoeba castellanii (strain ATCC 30010 / Neff) TaxID=1257118 RepID=L8HLG1_ACACF|nr:uncharacterized protein ACA1_295950 [Acanthamoeba castellanii str. Neff]ELR25508.1 hypothetical protein ACA1_295950 [Acanthamoeba castellanii str. Neff]